jgi:hypothetical protein
MFSFQRVSYKNCANSHKIVPFTMQTTFSNFKLNFRRFCSLTWHLGRRETLVPPSWLQGTLLNRLLVKGSTTKPCIKKDSNFKWINSHFFMAHLQSDILKRPFFAWPYFPAVLRPPVIAGISSYLAGGSIWTTDFWFLLLPCYRWIWLALFW